ncbi:MAG TPA: Nramp family divalent metal transporter [Casimicrobiaceae bacterium]|jgi:NRAMP (natural resistance-associated macrophage protein)-like metal ion transporter
MILRARRFLRRLGPGLITGAADDDPSGIATYSQAGAQFGFGMLWCVLFTTPLMVGIQIVSARIGRVTGHGIARNIRDHYPRPLLTFIVSLLVIANTLNIAADIGAMGDALQLVFGGVPHFHALLFGLVAVAFQLLVPYQRLAPVLKWLTLSLVSYAFVLLLVDVPWREVAVNTLLPPISFKSDYFVLLVGVLGTTISPYLFFWQASQEVEEQRAADGEEPLRSAGEAPEHARAHLRRIKLDTWFGMVFSNGIALAIMMTAAVTLHTAGITDVQTSAQAAQALRPLAGEFTFTLFAMGIVGTGLLAVPVLAGSAAYAVAESMKWPIGHALKPVEAKGFYSIITAATLIGVAIDFSPLDPFKALYWAAIMNGIVAVPIMALMMRMAVRPDIMGAFVIRPRLRRLGWFATALMAGAVISMLTAQIM